MSVKWEKKEANEGVLTFEVSPERFEEGLDEAFKTVVKDVQLPGFRKGRIPRKLFEGRFGVESLYQDAIDAVLPEAYSNAIDESGIEPIDQPSIDVGEIERGKPITFTAEVEVKPEVTLGEYKGLEVEVEKTEVSDEDVEEALKQLQEQQAELIVKEEGEVVEGDTVTIDFEGFIDGEPFEGGAGNNYPLEIGSGQFIPGFEEQLVGKKTGEETEVEVTFPEDYHEERFANEKALFKVTIHEIKEKELPELDDEFAKDQDVENLEELKTQTKERIEAERKQEQENQKRDQLLKQVADNATVEIPQIMIRQETDRMVQEFEQQLQMQGMNIEQFTKVSGQTEEEIREVMVENAEPRVKQNLVIEQIIKEENIEVSEEELNEQLEEMAKMYGAGIDELKQMLGGNTQMMEEDIKVRKAIELIDNESVVKEA